MGQDMTLNTLHGKNCSLWKERGEGKSYLLFDNMASGEAVWGMANSPTDISTFSNEELIPKLAIFFQPRICYNIAS